MFDRRKLARLGTLAFWLLSALASTAVAGEGGSGEYIGGFTDFASGYVPPKGVYFSLDSYYYHAEASKVAAGGRLAADVDADVWIALPQVTWITPLTIANASYGMAIAQPFGDISMDVGIAPLGLDVSSNTFGLGDTILVPLILGWHTEAIHVSGSVSVFVPTGSYDDDRALNLSKNYWAIDSAVAVSYLTKTGLDLSTSVGYTINFENNDTDYDSGDVLHIDFAAGQTFAKVWKAGLAGYAIVQITSDTGDGATQGDFKSDVYGLGPILQYGAKFGEKDVVFQAKWYHEFDARNHLEGDAFYLSCAFAF
jgi:hypothetical protein